MTTLILFSGGCESVALASTVSSNSLLVYIHPPENYLPLKAHPAETAALALKLPYLELNSCKHSRDHQIFWLLEAISDIIVTRQITEVWYGLFKGELQDPNKLAIYYEALGNFNSKFPNIPVKWPLINLIKSEQLALIPKDIRSHIVSCKYASNCGLCNKCQDLATAVEELRILTSGLG